MNIIPYNKEQHYAALCECWRNYDSPPFPPEVLPAAGYVAEDDAGKLIAYIGIYIEAGIMGYISSTISDRNVDRGIISDALAQLFQTVVNKANEAGCRFIYSETKNKSWADKLQSYGMLIAERDVTTFVLPLTNNTDVSFISD